MSTISQECYSSALTLLSHDPEGNMKKLLERIIDWVKTHPPKNEYDGFAWHDVHADAKTLNSLVNRMVLKVVFKSNKYCSYQVLDLSSLEKALADYEGAFTQEETTTEEIPDDLFSLVIGHEDKKNIIMRSLRAERPVHCILWGTVASAKTLILEDLGRLPQNRFVLGSNISKPGLFDILFSERPRFLIMDEIDKIKDSEVLSALLSLTHKGLITETKYRRHRTVRLKCWVFGSANVITHLPPEILSRFLLLRFRDYTDDEFYEVVVNVLKRQENVSDNIAIYIAHKVLVQLNSRDVRDCIKVARLLTSQTKEEVNQIVDILRKQR